MRKCIIVILLITIALFSCKEREEGIYPKYTVLSESVYASVIIEPEDYYKVYASVRGIVDQVKVKEGSLLKKGDTLVTLINDATEYQKKNAALQLSIAKENYKGRSSLVNDLKKELELARVGLKNDSINYWRQKSLWDKKIGSKHDFEQRELQYKNSKNKVELLENELKRRRDELEKQWQSAQNNYEVNRFRNDEYVIKSKIDGLLYEILKEPGESVNEQEPIAYIGSSRRFVIRMQVDEVDIVRIRKGQKVWISLDAYEKQVFEALVKSVIPKMNEQTQTFWVEASFVEAPEVLYSGLRGEANIIIQQKERTLVIPKAYLNERNEVRTEQGYRQVVLGLRSLEMVEVLEGVDSSTYILRPQ